MIQLTSVSKPQSSFEALETAAPPRITPGHRGGASAEISRSAKFLVVKGKSGPLQRPRTSSVLETVLGIDERVRILDTDLSPWRMICALRMRGSNGSGAIGTGWFVGPKTVITAGHCVHSNRFFGGWASSIVVIPGRNGDEQPFGEVTSEQFSSVDKWVATEDPDFDIGCIHLPTDMGATVGWFQVGAKSPEDLIASLVNVSGYPADRGVGAEQYHHRNRVMRVTERRLFYDVDTFGGQSGAPVWVQADDSSLPTAIGIHAYGVGGTPATMGIEANSAPRIIPEVLEKIEEWVKKDGGWPETT